LVGLADGSRLRLLDDGSADGAVTVDLAMRHLLGD
jgi:hypothetical protein